MIPCAAAWASAETAELDHPTTGVEATARSEALGTLGVRVWRVLPGAIAVGGGVDLPVTLWVSSGAPDTGRAVGELSIEVARRGPWTVIAQGALRSGVQVDPLGVRWGTDGGLGAVAGARGPWGLAAARVGWEQPLATAIWHSAMVEQAFSGGAPPRDGVVPFGLGRATVGVLGVAREARRWSGTFALDGVISPDRLGLRGREAVTLGRLPFRLAVGAAVRW